jgi:hypothetical protein
MFRKKILVLMLLTLVCACSNTKNIFADYSDSKIVYSGRIDSSTVNGAQLYWSGTSIKLNFEGSAISALMKDDKGDNYYNVMIDGRNPFIVRPDTTKQFHQLASKLSKGKHSIEIFKRTEWSRGTTSFFGFQIEKNAKLLPKSTRNKRKIEFYGNSITAGYAIEDFSGNDKPDSTYTNNYLSYAAITARHFKADYHCICRSGIGVTVSWFPLIMPEMYCRLNPTDPNSSWEFSRYSPDVVVINLFQNDSWIVNKTKSKEYKYRFSKEVPDDAFIINAYQEFVVKIRNHYPNANIICTLGSMDAAKKGSKWIGYIEKAVTNLNDKKIFTHIMPYIQGTTHPSIKNHEEMADSLIQFINKNIEW